MKIKEMVNIRRAKNEVLKQESEIFVSLDIEKIDILYSLICQSRKENIPPVGSMRFTQRSLFILLYLFSPKCLFGEKMPSGLRNKLATVMKINNPSSISHNSRNVMFLYDTYKDFREDVDYLYEAIKEDVKNLYADAFFRDEMK